uniref:cytochrome b n=1 Tax=Brueelia nebulosa TaxID=2972756 RepID=UPI0023AB0184|nr:cytochrome b [Brueelia nebulosa]WCF77112.1 cytochrome b [Brueelia nebulosa]
MSLELKTGLVDVPIPSSISYMYNFGSLLGVCLLFQIVSGLFLTFFYCASLDEAFSSVVSISNDVSLGWLVRSIHANGASFFFILLYLHIGRGMYYGSHNLFSTWLVGVIIVFLLMGIAFLGYVLPWGQMSFWGATVITNLLSAIPYLGETAVMWVWGGFSVGKPTLERFFSLHFVLPFLLLVLVMAHLFFLHKTGSTNPLGVMLSSDKVSFHSFFSFKDLVGLVLYMLVLMNVVLLFPDIFMDPDNFILANPMSTPPHIQPEWYFLFAYAILRSVPNKLGGVVALVFSILILMTVPLTKKKTFKASRFSVLVKILYINHVLIFFILLWIGAMPVELPYIFLGRFFSFLYFLNFYLLWVFSV